MGNAFQEAYKLATHRPRQTFIGTHRKPDTANKPGTFRKIGSHTKTDFDQIVVMNAIKHNQGVCGGLCLAYSSFSNKKKNMLEEDSRDLSIANLGIMAKEMNLGINKKTGLWDQDSLKGNYVKYGSHVGMQVSRYKTLKWPCASDIANYIINNPGYIQIITENHVMLGICKGSVSYEFFDPNYGACSFSESTTFRKFVQLFLGNKEIYAYYNMDRYLNILVQLSPVAPPRK